MPLQFEHVAVAPDQVEACLGVLVKNALDKKEDPGKMPEEAQKFFKALPAKFTDKEVHARLTGLAGQLKAAEKPVIICGTDIVRDTTPAFAADCALLLNASGRRAGVFYILPGAGSFGSALLSGPENSAFPDILDDIENGAVRALVVVESDPFRDFYDRPRLERALAKLDLLVVIDYLPTPMVERASVFYPASTVFETGSTFINQEGRVQFAKPVHMGGKPIWGEHPTHVVRDFVPGGDHRPAWSVLRAIAAEPASAGTVSVPASPGEWMPEELPLPGEIGPAQYPADGVRSLPGQSRDEFTVVPGKKPAKAQGLELLLVRRIFATGELAAYADALDGSVPEPEAFMHASDAQAAGLSDGDTVGIELEGGSIGVRLAVRDNMARGVLVLPRHNRLDWQKIKDPGARVPLDRIKKG